MGLHSLPYPSGEDDYIEEDEFIHFSLGEIEEKKLELLKINNKLYVY